MALADYYLCDRCQAKTFYDADLNYPHNWTPEKPAPIGAGDMKVLCKRCAATHAIRIVPIPASPSPSPETV